MKETQLFGGKSVSLETLRPQELLGFLQFEEGGYYWCLDQHDIAFC
jgi:hypothetical protein